VPRIDELMGVIRSQSSGLAGGFAASRALTRSVVNGGLVSSGTVEDRAQTADRSSALHQSGLGRRPRPSSSVQAFLADVFNSHHGYQPAAICVRRFSTHVARRHHDRPRPTSPVSDRRRHPHPSPEIFSDFSSGTIFAQGNEGLLRGGGDRHAECDLSGSPGEQHSALS